MLFRVNRTSTALMLGYDPLSIQGGFSCHCSLGVQLTARLRSGKTMRGISQWSQKILDAGQKGYSVPN
jgi:hypothetical protein